MHNKKFRIYDRQNESHIYENDASLHCFSDWMMGAFDGKIVNAVGIIDGDHTIFEQRHLDHVDFYLKNGKIVKEPRYIAQQAIGIQDKNGRDIYEEDICKFDICIFYGDKNKEAMYDTWQGNVVYSAPLWCFELKEDPITKDKNAKYMIHEMKNIEFVGFVKK